MNGVLFESEDATQPFDGFGRVSIMHPWYYAAVALGLIRHAPSMAKKKTVRRRATGMCALNRLARTVHSLLRRSLQYRKEGVGIQLSQPARDALHVS